MTLCPLDKSITGRYQSPAAVFDALRPFIREELQIPPEDEMPVLSPAARENNSAIPAGPKRVLTIIDSEDRHRVALARRMRWDGRNYPSHPNARKRRKLRELARCTPASHSARERASRFGS